MGRCVIEHRETREPKSGRRVIATYAIGLLGFAGVVLSIAVIVGAHRAGHALPLGTPITDEGSVHVADFASFANQHHPPSSGPHYLATLNPGFYSTPVPEGSYIHNLEHGYIVVLFKRSIDSGSLAAQLQDLPTQFPAAKYGSVKLIVAPYDEMPYPVVALAWDRELPLALADRRVLLRFYQQYVDHGPEDVP